jgi:hypothetical protein
MNERIRELMMQSWNTYYNEEVNGTRFPIVQKFDAEKFAELIVQECVNVLREESERLYKLSAEEKDELFASNFEICAEKCWDNEVMIKEHFGVKE